jgi:hypothetical protein
VRRTLAQIEEAFAEYAALSFPSPDGFRHFIPAYMGFTLRHLEGGAVAVDSTIWSLSGHAGAQPLGGVRIIWMQVKKAAFLPSFAIRTSQT